jgi:hypothetical protein
MGELAREREKWVGNRSGGGGKCVGIREKILK